MYRQFTLLMTIVFMAVFSVPSIAHAGLLEFFFPMLKKNEPTPIETLKAPFANEDAVFEGLDASGNRENSSPLYKKHRTNDKMTQWLLNHLPEILVYKTTDYRKSYVEKVRNFTKTGKKEYDSFLLKANIIKTLNTGAYDVSGFVKDYPVIINEGAVDNRYRWVYRMTVMITYIKAGATSYSTDRIGNVTLLDTGDAISQEWEVTFQIGRSREATNDAGVLFETWEVRKVGS